MRNDLCYTAKLYFISWVFNESGWPGWPGWPGGRGVVAASAVALCIEQCQIQ